MDAEKNNKTFNIVILTIASVLIISIIIITLPRKLILPAIIISPIPPIP